ncbi:MAG TPA: alkaline phosphatase family protein [Isosphaeraceae bacterium]|jgi:predicted AlkP superfamily phosphohydrolase/phosphomutase|nr:alkaline phosphatase family protein [Isosphaeraceae bacterium]
MRILVVGLDCAAPELLLSDERLTNFRRLMDAGCYGRLESIIPPITVPAWMCMATSQDPGSLGVYGFRNRVDHSYEGLGFVNSRSIHELAIWDQLAREGKKSVIIGVPPGYPPRKLNGMAVGCFLTPDTSNDTYTYPSTVAHEISRLVGPYPVDVKGFRTNNKAWLRDEIFAMSRKHFTVVRHFLQHAEWDYFQFVDIGLDRLHHGFWKFHDPQHVLHEPGNPYQNVIRDYYLHLDEELGRILELLDDDTIVLAVSDHGAQRLDGGFCVNEWLVRQGLLVLNEYPKEVTPFAKLSVNWDRTRVWSEGGYYARVFFNVKGREPRGVIEPGDYDRVRDEVQALFEATTDADGVALGTLVFRPEEVYRQVRNVAPDLIVHFGGLYWRSIGGVGYPTLHVQENDTGPDDCNHAQHGAFILAASNSPLNGPIEQAHLMDIAPTLLELAGADIPPSMQGRSLVAGARAGAGSVPGTGYSLTGEAHVRQRLSGLGYIS